jgi:predicted DNA-binding protein (MmcQ/YjbR family)
LSWVQHVDDRSLSDQDLRGYLRQSYALVVAALPKKARDVLGLRAIL